jgi:hypothetical protein
LSRSRFHRNRRGVAHLIIAVAVIVGLLFLTVSVVPSGRSNVAVAVTVQESQVCFLSACVYYFSFNSVTPSVSGYAPVWDWLAALSLGSSIGSSTLTLKVCVGPTCTTASESRWNSLLSATSTAVSDTLNVLSVAPGNYSVTAQVELNGQTQASGSSSLVVPVNWGI